MADEKRVVMLDDFEQRLMVNGLTDFRNDLLREDKPTEDVDDLILKIIDAPTKGPPWNRRFHEERRRSGVSELSPKAEANDAELALTKKRRSEREAR